MQIVRPGLAPRNFANFQATRAGPSELCKFSSQRVSLRNFAKLWNNLGAAASLFSPMSCFLYARRSFGSIVERRRLSACSQALPSKLGIIFSPGSPLGTLHFLSRGRPSGLCNILSRGSPLGTLQHFRPGVSLRCLAKIQAGGLPSGPLGQLWSGVGSRLVAKLLDVCWHQELTGISLSTPAGNPIPYPIVVFKETASAIILFLKSSIG